MRTAGPSARLGLIVNRNARGVNRRYARRPFWLSHLGEESVRVTSDLAELDAAVATFRDRGTPAVAMLGGDGSAHRFIEAIIRCYGDDEPPVLVLLAGGTLNGVARALGTGGRPERALPAAVASLRRSTPAVRARRVLALDDLMTGESRYGISIAAGLVYRVHQRYYRNPDPGLLDAVLASTLPIRAAVVGDSFYDGVALEVTGDGASWLESTPHTVLASIVPNPLLWFRPFREEVKDADTFHFGALSMPPRSLAWRFWSISRGSCRHPRLRAGEARVARVRGNTGYIIDGELYPGGQGDADLDVRISLGPRLRFLHLV